MKRDKWVRTEIVRLRKYLRILDDWKIDFVKSKTYFNQCVYNIDIKCAVIYNFKGKMPKDYLLHEMMHIALAEIYKDKSDTERIKEEQFVRAVCNILIPNQY